MIESTNGAAVRYRVSDSYGVSTACASPTVSPPRSVAVSERSRPISAAASDEMTRNVNAA